MNKTKLINSNDIQSNNNTIKIELELSLSISNSINNLKSVIIKYKLNKKRLILINNKHAK